MRPKGLYIHVPFCVRKCPYCDFYSVTELSLAEAYAKAVIRNIKAQNIYADTVYFGGGTPSLLDTNQIDEILSAVKLTENAEVTMECNPNTVAKKYLSEIKKAGVNRISFGIQSLNDNELAALGRIHNSETAEKAVYDAYDAGFCNISADIMLATAYQTKYSLDETLKKLIKLPLTHVSAYMLKIEPDTPYGRNDKLPKLLPDDDEVADMYLQTVEALEKAGFMQYEISNFAKEGFQSRHNLKYWHCEEYYGIGPSAHSYVNGVRKACPKSVQDFINAPVQQETVTENEGGDSEERTMLALRLTREGINLSGLTAERRNEIMKTTLPMIKAGLMRQKENSLMLTAKGCLVSNEIICRLLMC